MAIQYLPASFVRDGRVYLHRILRPLQVMPVAPMTMLREELEVCRTVLPADFCTCGQYILYVEE